MSPLYRGRTIVFVRAVRRMPLNREPANGHRAMSLAPERSWLSRFPNEDSRNDVRNGQSDTSHLERQQDTIGSRIERRIENDGFPQESHEIDHGDR